MDSEVRIKREISPPTAQENKFSIKSILGLSESAPHERPKESVASDISDNAIKSASSESDKKDWKSLHERPGKTSNEHIRVRKED